MNQVNQLNIDKVDLLNLENALKYQLSKHNNLLIIYLMDRIH